MFKLKEQKDVIFIDGVSIPILDKNGEKMSGKEFVNSSVAAINEYEKVTGTPAPFNSYKFVEWLKGLKDAYARGEDEEKYFKSTLIRGNI